MRLLSSVAFLSLAALAAVAQLDQPIEDYTIPDKLVRFGAAKIDANDFTDITTLRSQLNRESVKFALPASKPLVSGSDRIYAKAKPGVLVIAGLFRMQNNGAWHATCAGGIAIAADGKVATNYHVIEQANIKTLVAMTSEGQLYTVSEVLAANKQTDVAIVQLKMESGQKLAPLPIAPKAEVGDEVYVISHPDSQFYMLTKGIVSRYALMGRTPWMSVTAEYAKGSSGCPVLNSKGQVVGMVANTRSIYYVNDNGRQENLQMVVRNCVPSASILKLIR